MGGEPPVESLNLVKASRAWGIVIIGYATAAAGLLAFLTINGASGVPTTEIAGTAILLTVGLLLPAAGMLLLGRGFDQTSRTPRRGFSALGIGMIGLFFGVLLVYESSLLGCLVSALVIIASAALAVGGARVMRNLYRSHKPIVNGFTYLIIGIALTFSGAGLIAGSKIASYYLISQLQSTVYMDVGATVSAYGLVLAAYSFFVLHART